MALFRTQAEKEAEKAAFAKKQREEQEANEKKTAKEAEKQSKNVEHTIEGLYAGLSLGKKLVVFTVLLSQVDFGSIDKSEFRKMLDKSGIEHPDVFAADTEKLADCIMNDPEIYNIDLGGKQPELVAVGEPSFEEVPLDDAR